MSVRFASRVCRWSSRAPAAADVQMRRLRFEVAYDGTDFHGWQVQPGLRTIQGILEEIVGSMEGHAVHVMGSGRTDAGVHAFAQVAAVSLCNPIPPDNFRRAVNRLLPPTIRVSKVTEAAENFHPRFDARRKTYEYRLYREEVCSPFDQRFVTHHPYPLNEAAMAAAAPLLEGEHDFRSFASSDPKERQACKIRCIFSSRFERRDKQLVYRVTGSGFLKHMVRNIVGLMVEVGKGNLTNEDVLTRLNPGNEIRPGPSMPAAGLFLVSVEYDT
jgi:tRNA pseudouridine38-40 synthase